MRSLYLAPPSRLLEALRRTADQAETLMLIGHNPGLGGLAASLAGAGPEQALRRLAPKVPPPGVGGLTFERDRAAKRAAGAGRPRRFLRPQRRR